jgi:predicted PurR-regulated permease PerM
VIIATAVVLAVCYIAKLPLVVLLISVLLAFMLAPVADCFVWARLPRGLAALLAMLLLLAVLYSGFYISYNRAQAFLHDFPHYRQEIHRVVVKVRRQAEGLNKTASVMLDAESPRKSSSPPAPPASTLTDWLTQWVGPISEVVFAASFIPFLVYFMLSWQEHVHAASVMLFRLENRQTAYVTLGLISSMIRKFIAANVLVGLFMGLVSTVVFVVLGLPYPYFLGFISGYLSLIPYLGMLLAIIPPIIAGLGHLHSSQFAVIAATVVILHLFAINVLYPKFLGSRLQLNPLAVTLALLFWGWLWGPLGLVLAIPITAALKIILDHVESLQPYGAWLGE